MLHKSMTARIVCASALALACTAPAFAQTATVENGLGMARNWANTAAFVNVCIDKKLLDKTHARYVKFGSFLGGFILGSVYRDQAAVNTALVPHVAEGAKGIVHEFNEKGELMAYQIEFTKENCAAISGGLKTAFDQFSKAVLEDS